MTKGMAVTGLKNGGHMIEDIRVHVPYRVAVFIPMQDAYRSKDLWRGLDQGVIFQLDGGSALRTDGVGASTLEQSAKIVQLEALVDQLKQDNERLKHENMELTVRYESLQQVVSGINNQFAGLQGVLGQLSGLPSALQGMIAAAPAPQVIQQVVAAPTTAKTASPDVIGGEAPTFIPDVIKPADAKTRIQVQTKTSDGSNLSAAASRLKALRNK